MLPFHLFHITFLLKVFVLLFKNIANYDSIFTLMINIGASGWSTPGPARVLCDGMSQPTVPVRYAAHCRTSRESLVGKRIICCCWHCFFLFVPVADVNVPRIQMMRGSSPMTTNWCFSKMDTIDLLLSSPNLDA